MEPFEQFVLEFAPPPAPTFDNFIVGRNEALLAALHAFLADGFPHAVIALWGPAGSGRTHLLRAASALHGEAARYLAGDAAVPAIPEHGLIALDDAHLLSPERQQAWFEAFQSLRAHQARMLVSADRPIGSLTLRDDLRTRFASGVIFEVVALSDAETRAAMQAHATARRMPVPDGLFDYLLHRGQRDLGTQIALLDALDRYALATKRALTLPLARTVLQQLTQSKP